MCIKITALMANVALIAPLLAAGGRRPGAYPAVGDDVCPVRRAGGHLVLRPAAGDAGDRDAAGRKLSVKELGRDYRLVLKNLRFVAGALATGFVSLPLLADCPVAGDYYQRRTGHQL